MERSFPKHFILRGKEGIVGSHRLHVPTEIAGKPCGRSHDLMISKSDATDKQKSLAFTVGSRNSYPTTLKPAHSTGSRGLRE
jgi:hypothetical protein